MNPVYLSGRVPRVIADSRWGGGVHRDHLRELLRCDHRELAQAVAIAYRRHTVDVCLNYVVVPVPAAPRERAA